MDTPTTHDVHPHGTRSLFIFEFWPLMFFGLMFVFTMAIPLVVTGTLTLQGLIIFKVFALALLLLFTVPRVLPVYLLAMAAVTFGVQPGAIQVGLSIAICFIVFVVMGMVVLPQRLQRRSK